MSSVLLCTNPRQTCQHLGAVSYRKPSTAVSADVMCFEGMVVKQRLSRICIRHNCKDVLQLGIQ